jgi:signal transduction histidine kinase
VIAKRLLELMDGQLNVTSNPGQGAVFSVDLPLDLG